MSDDEVEDPDEAWNENNDDSAVTECDRCGRMRVCISRPDPFSAEVYPEDGPYEAQWWCGACYGERKDDI